MSEFKGKHRADAVAGTATALADQATIEPLVDTQGRLVVVTAAAGGGNVIGAAKGATASASVTATSIDADHTALDVRLAEIPVAEDNTNGVFQVAIKPLAVGTYSWSVFKNRGAGTSATVKNAAGNVRAISASNTNAAVRFFQLYDLNGATTGAPLIEFPIPATTGFIEIGAEFFGEHGIHFGTGITWGVSTTSNSFVAATAGDHATQVIFT